MPKWKNSIGMDVRCQKWKELANATSIFLIFDGFFSLYLWNESLKLSFCVMSVIFSWFCFKFFSKTARFYRWNSKDLFVSQDFGLRSCKHVFVGFSLSLRWPSIEQLMSPLGGVLFSKWCIGWSTVQKLGEWRILVIRRHYKALVFILVLARLTNHYLKFRSSRAESNWPLRATCTKTAAPTWFAEAIWTLLLFWPTVARSCQLDSALDERSFSSTRFKLFRVHWSVKSRKKCFRNFVEALFQNQGKSFLRFLVKSFHRYRNKRNITLLIKKWLYSNRERRIKIVLHICS